VSRKLKASAPKDETTPALVPKLRFPEFRGAEGWSEKPLNAIADINPANNGLPESFFYIDLESVVAGELKGKERISRIGAPSRAQRLVKRGDIIYQIVRPYQRNNLLCEFDDNAHYVASTGYAQLRAKGSNQFLYQCIHTDSFVERVIAKCTGSNYPAINSSALAGIRLPVPPSFSEQRKIAECLSSVDDLIAAQARKVDALKTHKNGLMQQLFPREGETQPRLRFPEFRDAGKWEDAPLGTLLISNPDYGVNAAAVPFSKDLPKYLRITDISENGRYLAEKQVSVDLEATEENYLKKGDIVLARTGASVGKSYQYRQEDGKLVFAGFLIRIKPNPQKLISTYLADFLTTEQFWKWVAVTSARSGQPGINSTEYSLLIIPLPPTLTEQQRIADCLTCLDNLITAETQKLDALKTHKKGLMQQLFPFPTDTD
jgi:type I restriction enzyme S subunit